MSDPQPIPEDAKGRMLPGVAAIVLLLMVFASINVYAALSGIYGFGGGRYGVLGICTLMVVGLVGLMRMRRSGWAIVTAGCLLLSGGYLYLFTSMHLPGAIIQGLFTLVFFLYLVRPEVRDRML